ncbi:type I-E CRISPR-associated protein Cse2/CasB [Streptomyces sp. NPDC059215]|uniref:type I-E CRISPR-associated protein Cse2/CasB n=1 Tax=Streptomyces sp. NPDC059215 TaxID=3346772 RepID=UPI00367D44A7
MTMTPASKPATDRLAAQDAYVAYVLKLCRNKKDQADLRSGLGRPIDRCNYMHRLLVPRLMAEEAQHRDARRAHYAVASLIAGRPRAARDAELQESPPDAAQPETASDVAQFETPPVRVPAPEWWKRPNLGASLAEGVNRKIIKPDTAESDLHLMARQSSDAIHPRLPALTRQLLGKGVTIDWAVLLYDLTWWNRDQDRIATRWLESYFRVRTREDRDYGNESHGSSETFEENH